MTRIMRSKRRNSFQSFYLSTVLLFSCSVSTYSRSLPSQSVSPGAAGQSTIFSKTELVVLPVNVTDANGNFISGLSLQNFRVYEDGRLQKVTAFQEGDTPVTVGLIVDHSRSMGPKLPEVAAAVSAFAQSSNPQDEMFVVDFNDDVSVELLDGKPFTSDPNELEKAVSAVSARGRTALYDAVAEGLIHLQLGHWDKKALIIVSDGGDNASQQKYSQVLALAQQSQVSDLFHRLGGRQRRRTTRVSFDGFAKTPAASPFSRCLWKTSRTSRNKSPAIFANSTRSDLLPSKTSTADSFRKIEVKVAAPGHGKIHVRTRPGYFRRRHEQASLQRSRRSAS